MRQRFVNNFSLIKMFVLLAAICLISCNYSKNDIYATFSNGSSLKKETVRSSNQIIFNNEDLILVSDNSSDADYTNYHLLFYDSFLKLKAACYLPSIKVDSVKHNSIYATLHKEKHQRKGWFSDDIPKPYQLILTEETGGIGRKSDKLIKKITLRKNLLVTFETKKSKDPYAGLDLQNADDQFRLNESLELPMSELYFNFDYKQKVISTFFYHDNRLTEDLMIVKEQHVLDDFYIQLWSILNDK